VTYSVFVAGTSFSGKTALCLGLYGKLQEMGLRVGYFKPVGQGLKMIEGKLRDPDAVLMKEVMGLHESIDDISPIVLGKRYLDQFTDDVEKSADRINESFKRVSRDKDVVLMESAPLPEALICCGLDLPRFSREFNAGVVFSVKGDDDTVAERAMLYKLFVEQRGGKMLGVVLNFVPIQQLERMRGVVSNVLERCGLSVIGIVPDHKELTMPTVYEIVDALDAEVLAGKDQLDTPVDDYLIGAMTPESALSWLRRSVGRAFITGGDRTDMILTALETKPSAIILTGGIYPSAVALSNAKERSIPMLLVTGDTYTIVTKLEMLSGRIVPSPTSTRKIQLARRIIGDYIDLKKILDDYVSQKQDRSKSRK